MWLVKSGLCVCVCVCVCMRVCMHARERTSAPNPGRHDWKAAWLSCDTPAVFGGFVCVCVWI